ncbi:MAG: rod shape-determining protein [Selenomonadaceae bacterium]|nr:rod shape-determining protein [Selenomonadaceae bacterium]
MPRKKKILTEDEEKIPVVEEKPKRTRRKKIDTENISAVEEKPKRTRRKKVDTEDISATEEKKSAPKTRRGLAKKIDVDNSDIKSSVREKLFALDIGTRSVIGIVAEKDDKGQLKIIATHREEHQTRAMLDGQIHDVPQVSAVINKVRDALIEKVGKLKSAAVAAAGRALYTMTATAEVELHGIVTAEQQSSLDFAGVQLAQSRIAESQTIKNSNYYCVGFSVISYELDGIRLKSLIGQRGKTAKATVIATFLPRQVIDSMQSALTYSKLEMKALTLEPIAAINVLIPPTMRHLNLVLVDIGAGTSDVAITKNGSVIAYGMVPVAGDEVTEALSQKFLLDFNVAEEVKRKAALGESAKFTDILGGTHVLSAEEIISPIEENISKLASAIAKTVYDLNGGETPQAVMLVGGGALTPHLQKYVADALNIPEMRVGVRRPDVVDGISSIPKELCLPDAVTPLGILKIASTNTLHFLTVYVNNSEYTLFHFRELNIGDALLSAGIQMKKMNGKPGLGLMVMVDGEKKVFPGSMGTLAKLTLNGKSATLESKIENDSVITVERGTDGKTPTVTLGEVVTLDKGFSVKINGNEEKISPKVTVNGEFSLLNRILKDGDEVKTISPHTVGEVLRLAGYPPTGRKIYYTLNGRRTHYTCTPEILMDESPVQISLPIKDGDSIDYIAKDTLKVSDIINISGINSHIKIIYNGDEFEIPTTAKINLMVNGRPATMNTFINDDAVIEYAKTEKKSVTVSDALLAVNFKAPDSKSRITFSIKVNGHEADFADSIHDGDNFEVVLKTHDGQELSQVNSVEIPVNNLLSTRNNPPNKKLTIQDFIRND